MLFFFASGFFSTFFYKLPILLHLRELLNLQTGLLCCSRTGAMCNLCCVIVYFEPLLSGACKKIIEKKNENKWRSLSGKPTKHRLNFVHFLSKSTQAQNPADFKRYVYFLWKFIVFFCKSWVIYCSRYSYKLLPGLITSELFTL